MRTLAAAMVLITPLLGQATEEVPTEYVGKITNLLISKSGAVMIGVNRDEDNPLDCQEGDWPVSFDMQDDHAQNWLDFLMLARNTNQTIRLGYGADSDAVCSLEYVAVMQGDGYAGGGVGDEDGRLVETGALGNVALLGSNGLTETSFKASGHYLNDIVAAAFDGHTWTEKVNEDAGDRINRGLWLLSTAEDSKAWIQVDFGQKVKLAGLRFMLNEKATKLGRGPRDITVQVSNDGANFADHEAFRLAMVADQTGSFSSTVQARYLRVVIDSNHGDSRFVEIDELEVFQPQN
ncbi:discoidin domain-containing protein [Bowmanella dokdonensis]|uniref:Discoidin domain-containing protein n=1 Tax=Bowmanella dokdonensis TaxID=751969 RepID=A0A939IRG2_9ALTE|nr:discoidin domain-containing protein [Bowmanella dokdonensis]MBN7825617.1 discoidin domain-containing protein [Bowmanella dokdonensis]